jgi:hypothetical protein
MQRMTPELHRQIEAMLAEGHPQKVISSELRVSREKITKVAARRYRNLEKPAGSAKRAAAVLGERAFGGLSTRSTDPTPDEIEDMAYALRMARPESEAGGWYPPGVCRPLTAREVTYV